jgi:hypothetical protein
VWTQAELEEVLGPDAEAAIRWFGATEQGNFPEGPSGSNVLEDRGPRPDDETRQRIRARLLERREQRVRPGLDDKRLTSWNALMVSALADAGAALGRADLLDAAEAAAGFVWERLRDADGRLLRTFNAGEARLGAYLEDHAFLLEAMLTLYEATARPRWFAAARELADALLEHFEDPVSGGFFSTADDHEQLVARRKDLEDAPIPSGGSAAAFGLLRLARMTGEARYEDAALSLIRLLHVIAPQHPLAFGHLLRAIDFHLAPVREVALAGDDVSELARVVRGGYWPYTVLAGGDGPVPLLEGRLPVDGRPAAYVCQHFTCQLPVTSAEELTKSLQS